MSSDFTLHIPTVSPQLKYKNLNLKKPLLSLNTFMNLLERRIQDLDSKARSTSWTRNVGPGEDTRALHVTLLTSSNINQSQVDNNVVVIPIVFGEQVGDVCVTRTIAFTVLHVDSTRTHRSVTADMVNIQDRDVGYRVLEDFIRPYLYKFVPQRGADLKFKYKSYISSGERSTYVHEYNH